MGNGSADGRRRAEKVLRVLGPALLLGGMALGLAGMSDVTSAAERNAAPRHSWTLFAGIGVGFVGLIACQFGYAHEMLRLLGANGRPHSRGPVRTPVVLTCARCGKISGPEANFCAECGAALPLPPGREARIPVDQTADQRGRV